MIEDGHRVLYMGYIVAPTKVFIEDPCPFGQPIILTVAHADGPVTT